MSSVAVLGAGPIGAAVAHRLAERGPVPDVRLIDESEAVASGKALDIRQSGPIARFDTVVTASADALTAVGADVIVLADSAKGGEWQGEPGLGLLRRLLRAGTDAPFVFAGPSQMWLMETAARELGVRADRIVGTAASAVAAAVRALASLEAGHAGVDVTVAGRPPALVVAWSSATVSGIALADRVPPHRLVAMTQALPRLWPPGPQAIAAATAQAVEGLLAGSRRLCHAMTMLEGEFGVRGVAAMLPLELGGRRVLGRVLPSLSPRERTDLVSGLTARSEGS